MKHLFHPENDSYTQDATDLSNRTQDVISDLFAEYQNKGYSIRQISSIMESAVNEWSLIQILDKRVADAKMPTPEVEQPMCAVQRCTTPYREIRPLYYHNNLESSAFVYSCELHTALLDAFKYRENDA